MAITKTIARYKGFYYRGGARKFIYFATFGERAAAIPEKLHCFKAEILHRVPLKFNNGNAGIASITDDFSIQFENGEIHNAVDLWAALDESDLKEELRRTGAGSADDIMALAHGAITRAFGRLYPEASISIEGGGIIVDSPTAIPSRVERNSAAPRGVSRSRRHEKLHIWLRPGDPGSSQRI